MPGMTRTETILVVDDEPGILQPVQAYLKQQGYSVLTASCAKDAFGILKKETVDLMVLDLMLPDLSGEEICARIKETSNLPIIMLTAKISEDSQLHGLNIGADDYITKPFSLKVLVARIKAVLRRLPQSELPTAFQQVKLTATETKLVQILSRQPARIFTREELINAIFDERFDSYDRVIDTHVKNLRKKIGTDAIQTVFGLGYKWGANG